MLLRAIFAPSTSSSLNFHASPLLFAVCWCKKFRKNTGLELGTSKSGLLEALKFLILIYAARSKLHRLDVGEYFWTYSWLIYSATEMVMDSLRNKRFQLNYCAKVGNSKKNERRGNGRGEDLPFLPSPLPLYTYFFASQLSKRNRAGTFATQASHGQIWETLHQVPG